MTKQYETVMMKREFLQNVLTRDVEGAEIIEDEIVTTSRWSIHHWLIFKFEDKFYGVAYSRGATEYQEEWPFEDEGNEVEVYVLEEAQKTITTYIMKEKV